MANRKNELAYVKVTNVRGKEIIVAVCDEELLGRKLEDKDLGISFEVRESFYKGMKIGVDDSIEYLKKASIANLIGVKVVEKAINSGIINPSAILRIAGIPHAQFVKI